MKEWYVHILRKATHDAMWKESKVVVIEAKTERSAFNKAEKSYASPYCMIGRVERKQD